MTVWYVWRSPNTGPYVSRCSRCGAFKGSFLKHFFFTGIYCIPCVHEVLYKNCWTFEEINAQGKFEEVYIPQWRQE